MADIRTITILPTQIIPNVQQVQGSTGAGAQSSGTLTNLTPGTILSGFIVNRDLSGNPILRTASGDITFSSNFFLSIGSEVAIRVENTVGGTLAHILTVNGQPPEIAAAQSAFAQEPDVIVSQNLSAPASQPQTAATVATEPQPNVTTLTVTGTLIAQPQHTSDAAPPPLPTGTQLTLKVTGLTTAPTAIPEEMLNYSPPQVPAAASPPSNPAFYTTYAKAAGTPAPATPIAAGLPQATPATPTTNVAPLPAVIPNATPSIPQPGQGITATVISNESSRETSLQTPIGIIRLQPNVVLPTGSTVTFEITDTMLPEQTTTAPIAAPLAPAPLVELAQQWTSLQQIFSLLAGRAPASGFNFIQDTMPWVLPPPAATAQAAAATQNIPAGLMLFMAALRGGNFSNWLGQDNVKWLQDQGHDALVKRADGEFTLLARQFTETQPQHWQPLFFPVAVAGELQQARLFVKRDRKQGNNPQGKKNDDTRFVVEVDLTQLGEMQMDGFVRRRDKEVQFDLVIRSLTPLSKEIQQDILQIYSVTGELTGYKGSLAFQTVRDFPVNPMEEIVGHTGTVVA